MIRKLLLDSFLLEFLWESQAIEQENMKISPPCFVLMVIQDGPLLVINGDITPVNCLKRVTGVVTPIRVMGPTGNWFLGPRPPTQPFVSQADWGGRWHLGEAMLDTGCAFKNC